MSTKLTHPGGYDPRPDVPKPGESLVGDAKRELAEYLRTAPSVALVVAAEDFKRMKKLHNDLFNFFRVRFSEDTAKWPVWARGAALPMQRVLIGAKKRLGRELERERARRNGETTK